MAKKDAPIPTNCFRCDGTGNLCNSCGESERACSCEDVDGGGDWFDCPDCEGTGKNAHARKLDESDSK